MVTPFEIAIKQLEELGFFTFVLPYMLTAAIFYGLLRKSEIFGPPERNVVVNGVVALVSAMLVWASPILLGIDIKVQLTRFFAQSLMGVLTLVVALIVTSMFFGPNLPEKLSKALGAGQKRWVFIIFGLFVGGAILISSGLIAVLSPPLATRVVEEDIMTLVVIVFLIAFALLIIGWIVK